MPTITELPNGDTDGYRYEWWDTDGDEPLDFDDQLQQMDYEHSNTENTANSSIPRDAGREVLDAQIAQEREQYQPTASEKLFAIVKSMLLRGMVIYFLMTFFRRPQPNQTRGDTETDDTAQLSQEVATSLFDNKTVDNEL